MSLRNAYDLVLVRQSQILCEKWFKRLDVADADDRALLRLLCMGGVVDLSAAQLYESVWGDLEAETKASLVANLNVDGSVEQPAMQATYAPALLTKGVDVEGVGSADEKRERLHSLLRYLSRVLRPESTLLSGSVVVIERNVLKVVQDIVRSEEFRANPAILDYKEVPQGIIAQISRNV
ncbi:hypothetical protein NUW58_g10521 [Xylaria curta]|uniref:Uncharacterized protein n=1 Tax=Xylaria curta TaxID=42375 RepID=A0ACC1MLI0_9PEZI|nr:hypothetical protein NUW58_g10521 [Xylaria curta]